MELLIVIAIMGILFAATLRAINPLKQLTDAKNAKRIAMIVEMEKALDQWVIDGNTLEAIPETKAEAKAICQESVSVGDCAHPLVDGYDLSFLVSQYVAAIPVDDDETTEIFTGYRVYVQNQHFKVCNPRLEDGCGS